MIKSEVKIKPEQNEIFDRKQIALAIRNINNDGEIECSFLEEGIIKNCDSCSMKMICDEIDYVAAKVR